MSSEEIERLPAGKLVSHLVHRGAVPRAEAGVDNERSAIANNVSNVRHGWNAVVRNDVDVGRDLAQPLDLDDRRRQRLRQKRRRRPDECQYRNAYLW